MFLQVDMVRKRGQTHVPQGVLNVYSVEFQLNENFLKCSEDPIMVVFNYLI